MSTVHGVIHTSIVCVYEFRRGFCTSVLSLSPATLDLHCANLGSQLCSCLLLSQSCYLYIHGNSFTLQCSSLYLSPATLDLQGYRHAQQGGGSQARSFKDQITGLFRPGPTSENQQPSSDSLKPKSNFFLELPVKDHRSVMIAWWQCQ